MAHQFEPSHFAFAGFAYAESVCNTLIVKGLLSEAEKRIVLQVAIDNLRSSDNPEFQKAAELIKEINSHMTFD